MSSKISVSIDVNDIDRAIDFYSQALQCELKTRYTETWVSLSLDGLDIHLLQKAAGTCAAGNDKRNYERHWTPVHLDFGVADVGQAAELVTTHGGTVEGQQSSAAADIAFCADPFGNGFCLIRE